MSRTDKDHPKAREPPRNSRSMTSFIRATAKVAYAVSPGCVERGALSSCKGRPSSIRATMTSSNSAEFLVARSERCVPRADASFAMCVSACSVNTSSVRTSRSATVVTAHASSKYFLSFR
jgi:hypothetical protein